MPELEFSTMRGRLLVGVVVSSLLLAVCGGDSAESPQTTSPTTRAPDATTDSAAPNTTAMAQSTTTAAPTTTEASTPAIDLELVVNSTDLAPPGMTPVAAESGEITLDLLPPDSALRSLLGGFEVIDGYATVYASENGNETIIVAAARFRTEVGASESLQEFQRIRGEIGRADGPFIASVTGDPLMGTCASIDLLEADGPVVTLWLNTSDCHSERPELPPGVLECPEQLAAGESGEVVIVVPTHYEPFTWEIGPNDVGWLDDSPISVVETIEIEGAIGGSIFVDPDFSGRDRDTQLSVIFYSHSQLEAFGGSYRLGGPRGEAECTIRVTKAG